MKGKILQFGEVKNGQYRVKAGLSTLPDKVKNKLKDYINYETPKGEDFKKIGDLQGNTLTYTSETLLPGKYDSQKQRVLVVLGNPAIHSITNKMFFFSRVDGKRHSFWGKLERAGLLPVVEKEGKNGVKEEAEERKRLIHKGNTSEEFVLGLTTFYSFPTPVKGPYKDVAGIEKIFGKETIKDIQEDEYKRIKSYPFSKGTILVFTQESSHKFFKAQIKKEGKHPFKLIKHWPIRGKGSGGKILKDFLKTIK